MPLSPLLLAMALTGPALFAEELSTDKLDLVFIVDDEIWHRLEGPSIRLDMEGAEPVPLTDDGSVLGDTPGDAVWYGKTSLRRTPSVAFTLTDPPQGKEHGSRTVYLPAAGEATIKLRTVDSDAGFLLEDEGSSPQGAKGLAPPRVAPTRSPTEIRETWILWTLVVCTLAGVSFIALRIHRAWVLEVRPTLLKLNARLSVDPTKSDDDPSV